MAISIHSALVFQSLSGVLDVCNLEMALLLLANVYMFQSLSGVLDVCNRFGW